MGGDDQYRINTLLFCLIFFIVLTAGHALALYVKGNMEINNLEDELSKSDLSPALRAQMESNLADVSNISFWDVLSGVGSIAFGLDLPLPFAIVLTLVNSVLLVLIALLAWSFIKAHIPFISG